MMRKQQGRNGTGQALLDDESKPRPATGQIRRPLTEPVRLRRELVDEFADDADTEAFLRASGRNRRVRRGLIPQTKTGRIAACVTALACLLAACGGTVLGARFITTDPRFRIPSSKAIEIDGNSHLTRSQMLSVFGEDIDRNIFSVPMEQRRGQLERMPWVEHATVMRLLPNKLRVHIAERVPVAFVREGSRIGLVDANGVLLDIPPETPGVGGYTFPVLTGVKASETAEARVEQMKLYAAFVKDLDSDGKATSALLSEIDLSDPEDAKAMIPDHDSEILVHFGHDNFLARYKRYEEHIAEWRSQYPRLSNVDMRYERQVVLQMPPKDATAPALSEAGKMPTASLPALAGHGSPLVASHSAVQKPTVPSTLTARAAAPKHIASVKPLAGTDAKGAATRKRVEAIKAWMAQRQKARTAVRSKSPGAAPGAINLN